MNFREFFGVETDIEIVDIGASLGEQPIYKELLTNGWGKVTGFEPNPAEVEKLNAQKKSYETYLPYFIGNGEPGTFYETNWALTGSLFEPNTELLSKFTNLAEVVTLTNTHAVQTHRLDDVSEITDIDFLKMDIQGAELAALQHGTTKISQTMVIQLEVEFLELYKGQAMFADVDIFLRQQGFQFHTFPGFGMRTFKPIIKDNNVNAGVRQQIWSDAIYVRNWMDLSSFSADKLRKYALILHVCYQSADLAHLVLTEMDKIHGTNAAPKYMALLTGKQG